MVGYRESAGGSGSVPRGSPCGKEMGKERGFC